MSEPARVAFLGPSGTFTHQGVVALRPDADVVPVASAGEALAAVASGAVTYAVLPIDNSINGVVVPTLDGLMAQPQVSIVDSVVIPVSFDAYVRDPAVAPRVVVSHPHALAQCRGYIDRLGLPTREAVSTAAACRDLRPGEIGLGPAICGDLYDLHRHDRAVEDNERALTQFALIASASEPATAPQAGAGGAGLLVGVLPDANIPGLLRRLLGVLEERGINMTNLVTRPVPASPGIFEFLLFLSGSFSDDDVAEMRDAWAALGGQARALGRISPLVELAGLGQPGPAHGRAGGAVVEGFARVCVVGAGLIGGSVALRLHERGLAVTVVDPDAGTRAAAAETGLAVAEQVPSDADLVVVAAPLDAVTQLLADAAAAAPGALVVDVGSVKEPVQRAVDAAGLTDRYVGAHPMNGAEVSGFGYARADLLSGITWAVTLPADTSDPSGAWTGRMARVVRLVVGAFGSRVVVLDAAEHDRSVALISHLPHVLANTLLEVVERAEAPTAKHLAAGSFREGTRVAGRNPVRTRNMLADNAAAVGAAVDDVVRLLEGYRAEVGSGDATLIDRLTRVSDDAPAVRRPTLSWTTLPAAGLDALLAERGAARRALLVRGTRDGDLEWAEA